jgi:hypothetical protein
MMATLFEQLILTLQGYFGRIFYDFSYSKRKLIDMSYNKDFYAYLGEIKLVLG